MPKEIMNKEAIATDPNLTLIKAFRIANKRAGEAKRENNQEAFFENLNKIRFLAVEAGSRGFKIWVNDNGKTGHTYTKDYKLTEEADNNFEAHEARLASRSAQIETLFNAIPAALSMPSPTAFPLDMDETGMDNVSGLDEPR